MKALIAALLTGLLVSLGLFWLMQTMLMGNQQNVKKTENLNMMQFIRLIRKPPEKPKPKKPPEKKVERVQEVQEKPQPKKAAPTPKKPVKIEKKVVKEVTHEVATPKPDMPLPTIPAASGPVVSASQSANAPAKKIDKGDGGTNEKGKGNGGGISTGVIALSRVPPKYPPRAAKRHIEGWVKIEFTITTTGTVINPVVVDAQPAGTFDDAALKAISQWTFKQKIVDGVAVTQRAVQTLQFKLIR
ncbi:MAG: TonB family protein [Gammaproteobacteria bacterium]